MVKISVVMPVYNTCESYLRESIESILNQTFEDFEFIIVDDGSTNNAPDVISEYQKNDGRIKVVFGEHRGIAAALNIGLQNSKGEYIARMDSDDISFPNRFEEEVHFLEENTDVSIVGTGINILGTKVYDSHVLDVKLIDVLNCCPLYHPTVMFRKLDFEKYDLKYNEQYSCSEDYELWSRAIQFLKIRNIDKPLLSYRRLKSSNSNKNLDKVFEYDCAIRKSLVSFLTDDKVLQNNLLDMVEKHYTKPLKFIEQIFSIKNIIRYNLKYKMITFLGIHIKVKR